MKGKEKKRVRRDRISLLLVILFIVGLSVMLYPTIADFWNSKHQSQAIASYDKIVKNIDTSEYDRMIAEAQAYNEKLAELAYPFGADDVVEGYDDILNIGGTGILGYITIEKIRVEIPIYHGTDEGVLQIAAGHLKGSSFPIGGIGTHSAISAHRGLPSAKLFTDLDKLELGDTFYITVLDRRYTYMVDQIRIVTPDDVNELDIDPKRDFCTLITCTPYGINTHRMLVRGSRIANEASPRFIEADAYTVHSLSVAIFIAVPLLVIVLFCMAIYDSLQKKHRVLNKKLFEEVTNTHHRE